MDLPSRENEVPALNSHHCGEKYCDDCHSQKGFDRVKIFLRVKIAKFLTMICRNYLRKAFYDRQLESLKPQIGPFQSAAMHDNPHRGSQESA
jgi:hypothetical protein